MKTHLVESTFNKIVGLKSMQLYQSELQHAYSLGKVFQILTTPCFKNTSRRLLIATVRHCFYCVPLSSLNENFFLVNFTKFFSADFTGYLRVTDSESHAENFP